MTRPRPEEYHPFYEGYISKVDTNDIIRYLKDQAKEFETLLRSLTPEQCNYQYEPGKWSIKEMVGHIVDAERIFVYRAMCISRGETQLLPGFEQDDYVRAGRFSYRNMDSLIDEFKSLRLANIVLLDSLDDQAVTTTGNANGHPTSVQAIVYILAGHLDHHLEILRTKYLAG